MSLVLNLDLTDYSIFLYLQQNPSLSNRAIAEKVGVSPESVRTRIHTMKSKGFLRPDRTVNVPLLGERLQTEVEAQYLPSSLGLERQHVIFRGIPDRASLNVLKRICNDHPYTHYRTTAYGNNASLYTQFDIPHAISHLMQRLYQSLQDLNLFEDFIILQPQYTVKNTVDFERWNLDENKWILNPDIKSSATTKSSGLEFVWSNFLENRNLESPANTETPNLVRKLDKLDMLLLRELTVNSRLRLKSLAGIYGKDATTISRRIKKIKENVAPILLLYYDRSVFGLTYPQIITGNFKTGEDFTSETFYGFINSGELPFECSAAIDDHSFLLYLTVPPSIASEFSEFIWDHAENMTVFQLQLNASFTYYFYHENYAGKGNWKDEEDYVLNSVLSGL
ncbi:MAG: Lrp/AsnC family transcriptional regulator [Candidatus Hodarchaeota archaeon]